jgi:uncharacterized membrane protein (GlpM family)
MLILKLMLVPSVVVLVSIASRHWGSFIAGILSGMPIIAAPITLLLAMEYGPEFAISASQTTILGVVAVSAFCFVYAWSSKVCNWRIAFSLSLSSYLVFAVILSRVSIAPVWAVAMSASVLFLLRHYFPTYEIVENRIAISNKEIVIRAVASLLLVLVTTSIAKTLGPGLSGVFVVFPIGTSILAIFTHIYSGKEQASTLLKGLMLGMFSIILFYLLLVSMPSGIGFYASFALSIVITAIVQVMYLVGRSRLKWNN